MASLKSLGSNKSRRMSSLKAKERPERRRKNQDCKNRKMPKAKRKRSVMTTTARLLR